MAYKDSGEIANNSNYALGDYSFRIERTSVPGSTNDKIEAICTDKDGKNARKSIQVPSSTQVLGWHVEANETEATVYATVEKKSAEPLIPGGVDVGSPKIEIYNNEAHTSKTVYDGGEVGFLVDDPQYLTRVYAVNASSQPFVLHTYNVWSDGTEHNHSYTNAGSFTYDGKTVYLKSINTPAGYGSNVPVNPPMDREYAAWTAIYANGPDVIQEVMIGRFAIEIEDAGGVGPGSDWTDPEDYDEDWEEGDPTHTLYVEVTGALSGRHNDPIEDPSYSYIPADKGTVKDYGCGGDGGHGGGGGAGASTVVVHKFATNQANSKEVTAIARRHGYGSGGGKGGKGGDGCILVYY